MRQLIRNTFIMLLAAAYAGTLSAEKPIPQIEILLSTDSSIYEEALAGMQSVIHAETDVRYVDRLLAENNDIQTYFKEHEATDPRVYIAFGNRAAELAEKYLHTTPVIFSMVNSPKSFNLQSGRICGVGMNIPLEQFFRTLHDINPGVRLVHSFYSTDQGAQIAREGEYIDLKHGILYNAQRVAPETDLKERLNEIKSRTEAFYMAPDSLYSRRNFQILSDFCKKEGIILMTGFGPLVKSGATFGLSPDYTRLGYLTGKMANRIMTNKTTCADEMVKLPDQTSFFLNEDYAEAQRIKVPSAIKERARLTRLFSVGVKLLNENKLKSSRRVFEVILKKDPENRPANHYLEMIIEKQTGEQTRLLLNEAEEYFKSKRYALARQKFAAILKLNPKSQTAREGFNKSVRAQSNLYYNNAERLRDAGQPFRAIKSYIKALKTWPGNREARERLKNLRMRESAELPEYMKKGIARYKRRHYERAIQIFENILLIRPGFKKADDYLRLSRKKKKGINRLKNKQRNR